MNKLLEIASAQVGLKETSGKNDGPEIEKFTGGRQEPWCAHFVAWCFRESGHPLVHDYKPSLKVANPLASVSYLKSIFQKYYLLVDTPLPGDVVFFSSRGNSDAGQGRHCGIVESISSDSFQSIEGNYGNKVTRVTRKLNDSQLWGFGRKS
jgi:hypothetical protein